MNCEKRGLIVESVIADFLSNSDVYPTINSINQGSCGEFAHLVNEAYVKSGLSEHRFICTYDFISSSLDSGVCEYIKEWQEDAMLSLGVPKGYFEEFKKNVTAIDKRGVVGYHVWLFDGLYHYDASCLTGVKNPLELPFHQSFTK